jgi:alpha-glucosidase
VFYQIYPRSFADGNHDGTGDLQGIIRRLDYLAWLGIEAIWLSPIYPSPMKDGGYDVQNYCDVDPAFGTLDIFDQLVTEAHSHGIRIVLDWVPNHTSDQHPWFIESRSSRDNPKRGWYIWHDQPNNWQADIKRGSAWALEPVTNQYYLHSYLPEQPDLNWDNPEVRRAMIDVLRFWLDRGVDGFRCDVINMIAKDSTFADWPEEQVELVHRARRQNLPKIHPWLREIHAVLDGYPQQPVLIGELALEDTKAAHAYYGNGDELELMFNTRLSKVGWVIDDWKRLLSDLAEHANLSEAWPSAAMSSHDVARTLTRFGSLDQAKAAAVILMALPGSPFIYAGEELGLANGPADNLVDPGGRDGSRAPIPWNTKNDHGWPTPSVLPFPTNAATANYQIESADKRSILWLYKRLISLFKADPNLTTGSFNLVDSEQQLLIFRRGNLEVVANFASQTCTYEPRQGSGLVISTYQRANFDNQLRPYEAVVLSLS